MNSSFFTDNRNKLIVSIKEPGIVVLCAYGLLQRTGDTAHPFTQESNFWYLTGVDEPSWQLIIDSAHQKSWLVAPFVDAVHRTFEGGMSDEMAIEQSGASEVISQDEAVRLLRDLASKYSIAYTLGEYPHKEHFNFVENPAQKQLRQSLERTFNSVQDCRKELAKLRSIKQPEEIALIKKAIHLTTDAFEIVKQQLPELKYEYEVEAVFDYHFKHRGATHAYDPIVAGGQNACTLHYVNNGDKLKAGSLLLMDIGASYGGYAADVSRTFTVDTPTKRQVELHAALESAHKSIIKLFKPGLPVTDYHQSVDDIMKRALIDVGLLKSLDDVEMYRRYFPHAVSHGLGIDVHDSLGGTETFQPGMILTVEPGIYIPEESIGLRIEDDILITETGHQNLSRAASTALD